jgi:hypothetical protein
MFSVITPLILEFYVAVLSLQICSFNCYHFLVKITFPHAGYEGIGGIVLQIHLFLTLALDGG